MKDGDNMNREMDVEYLKKIRDGEIELARDGEKWTTTEKKLLIDAFAEGKGISAIALDLERSERAVVQQLTLMNCYFESSKKRSGSPHAKVCKCYSCALQGTKECKKCTD